MPNKKCPFCESTNLIDVDGYLIECRECDRIFNEDEV